MKVDTMTKFIALWLMVISTTLAWSVPQTHYSKITKPTTPMMPSSCECTPTPEPICCPNSNELKCRDGLIIRATNPKMCMLGDEYPLEFEVQACDDVTDVEVHVRLPEGVTYQKSCPEGKLVDNLLTWNLGTLKEGQRVQPKVWLKCECEGDMCASFYGRATPIRFCSLVCAKARLVCQKSGPAKAAPGDRITYRVTVTNRGSCAAENVVLTDNIPDGLEHPTGQRTLCYNFGNINPGDCRSVDINLTACKRGNVCNIAVITSCNADSVSCQACTTICSCDLKISKTGPKEQFLGKNSDYQITVVNTGDLPLTNVVVTDCAASSTSIVSANGANIRGNQAVWKLKELNVGEKVVFGMTLSTCAPGCYTSRATVNTCEGCNGTAEISTRWKGRPSIRFNMTNTADPICLNETTCYNIQLSNQGPEPDHNVKVVVRFPRELQPVSISGDLKGVMSGQTVTFQPTDTMWSKQNVNIRIEAKGRESGEGRVVAEVTSDTITTPITQQVSTQVY